MKKTKLLILIIIVLTGSVSCKKDYPKDIPDWLKGKIDCCKDEYCSYQNSECHSLVITEYTYDPTGETIFYFHAAESTPKTNKFYDYNGNLLCSNENYLPPSTDTCGSIVLWNLTLKRTIWESDD